MGDACNCIDSKIYKIPQVVHGAGGSLQAILTGTIPIPENGTDGRYVSGVTINGSNELIITLSDASTINAGNIQAGADGSDGTDGEAGVSVSSIAVNGSNHLLVTLSDATIIDAGEITVDFI